MSIYFTMSKNKKNATKHLQQKTKGVVFTGTLFFFFQNYTEWLWKHVSDDAADVVVLVVSILLKAEVCSSS